MSAWGQTTDLVLLTLRELGRGSAAAVAEEADLEIEPVRKALARMAGAPVGERRAHVVAWCDECVGQRRYPRPVYAWGPGRNVRRPSSCRRQKHAARQREMKQRYQRLLVPLHGPMNQKAAARLAAEMRRRGLLL